MFRFNRRPDVIIKESNIRIWIEQDRIFAVNRKNKLLELKLDNQILVYTRINGTDWIPYPTIIADKIVNEIIEFQLLGEVHENNSI